MLEHAHVLSYFPLPRERKRNCTRHRANWRVANWERLTMQRHFHIILHLYRCISLNLWLYSRVISIQLHLHQHQSLDNVECTHKLLLIQVIILLSCMDHFNIEPLSCP